MSFLGSLITKATQEINGKISSIGNLFKTRKGEIMAILNKNNIAIDKSSITNTANNIINGLKTNKNFSQDIASLLSTPATQYGPTTGIVPPTSQYDGSDPNVLALADALTNIANSMDTNAAVTTLSTAMQGVDLSTTESTTTTTTNGTTSGSSNTTMYVIIGIVLLLVILLIVFRKKIFKK